MSKYGSFSSSTRPMVVGGHCRHTNIAQVEKYTSAKCYFIFLLPTWASWYVTSCHLMLLHVTTRYSKILHYITSYKFILLYDTQWYTMIHHDTTFCHLMLCYVTSILFMLLCLTYSSYFHETPLPVTPYYSKLLPASPW